MWVVEHTEEEKRDQLEYDLYKPLPGMTDKPTDAEIEMEASGFDAFYAQITTR